MKLPTMATTPTSWIDHGPFNPPSPHAATVSPANGDCDDQYNAMVKACGGTLAATLLAGGIGAVLSYTSGDWSNMKAVIGPGSGLATACPYYASLWALCKLRTCLSEGECDAV